MRQNVQENAKISDNDSQLPDGNSWKINADHRLSAVREVADEILTFADMAKQQILAIWTWHNGRVSSENRNVFAILSHKVARPKK